MTHEKLKAAFLQGGERKSAELLQDVLRASVREAFWQVMAEEVDSLCGPRYDPAPGSLNHRAGSETGSVYLGAGREKIRRPRVRHQTEGETHLDSYLAASSQQGLFEEIVGLVAEGMSQRGLERATKGAVSKSAVSRMWEEKSREQLALLRERPLTDSAWLALMIDGVFVGGENCIVIALGIDMHGRKQVLDFEAGTSESAETVMRLLNRLQKRGVSSGEGRRLLVVRDGSEAIKSAVKRLWPEALQQTCLVHLERNIADRLRRRDRSESQRLFRCLRQAEGGEAGEEAFEDLREFLAERNAAAALALNDRKDEALTVHRLNIPATLNVTLLSTNAIENVIRNWREQTNNVKRWNVKGDMLSRWAASGLLWAESGFRRVRHHEDLPKLREALRRPRPSPDSAPASSLRSQTSTPSGEVRGETTCTTTPN
jgi:transposase-like protein